MTACRPSIDDPDRSPKICRFGNPVLAGGERRAARLPPWMLSQSACVTIFAHRGFGFLVSYREKSTMKRMLIGMAVLALASVTTFSMTVAQDKGDKKAKHTIKEVMKTAHKEGLLKKVTDGKASDDE